MRRLSRERQDMPHDIQVLTLTAASIAFLHTLLGPDHYIPFVMMSRARGWSLAKTAGVTVACGLGHIFSSILLGSIGVAFGIAATRLEVFESARGSIAAWGLIAFGLVYLVWGIRQAVKNRPHSHWHNHSGDVVHTHEHTHAGDHAHVHTAGAERSITPWVLFTIFVFGPCEALIPVLMYPAFTSSVSGLIWVTTVFGVVTLATMLVVVLTITWGANLVPLGRMERYTHALAGAAICVCGIAIHVFGI